MSQFVPATGHMLISHTWLLTFFWNAADEKTTLKILHPQTWCPRLGPGIKPGCWFPSGYLSACFHSWVWNGPERASLCVHRTWLSIRYQLSPNPRKTDLTSYLGSALWATTLSSDETVNSFYKISERMLYLFMWIRKGCFLKWERTVFRWGKQIAHQRPMCVLHP